MGLTKSFQCLSQRCGLFFGLGFVLQGSLLKEAPDRFLVNEVLKLEPISGHHFNLKAPNQCGKFSFIEKTVSKLTCQLSEPGKQSIVVNICDDNESFCKPERFTVQVSAPKGWKKNAPIVSRPQGNLSAPKNVQQPTPAGFLSNAPEQALQEARKNNRLMLIDFYGIWCPPCNLLDEYVFDEASFQRATAEMVKLSMDVDATSSWDWVDHFHVSFYPTLIIANTDLQEVGRLVGYYDLSYVLNWLKEMQSLRQEPVEAAQQLIDKDRNNRTDARLYRVGEWLQRQNRYDEALRYLKDSPSTKSRQLVLEIGIEQAEKQGDKPKEIELYQQWLKEFPESVDYAGRLTGLMGLDKTVGLQYLAKARQSLKHWQTSKELSSQGWNIGWLDETEGDLLAAAGDEKGSLQAYAKAADYYQEQVKKSPLKVARGANLRLLYFLRVSNQIDKAKQLAESLVGAYQDEFTFNYNYGRLLYRLKDYDKALIFAERALANGYGNNWLRSVESVAQIQLEQQKTAAAIRTIESALEKVVLPVSTNIRTHELVAALRDLLATAKKKLAPQKTP